MLLDETTNHLDLKYQIELLKHLSNWTKEDNKIAIAVLDDLNLVHHFSDNVCLVQNGEIVDYGTLIDVFKRDNLKKFIK